MKKHNKGQLKYHLLPGTLVWILKANLNIFLFFFPTDIFFNISVREFLKILVIWNDEYKIEDNKSD